MTSLLAGAQWLIDAAIKGTKKRKRSAPARRSAAYAVWELVSAVENLEDRLWTAVSSVPTLPGDWLESASSEGGFTDPFQAWVMRGDEHVDYYVFTISGLSWYYGCHVDGEWAYWNSCDNKRLGQLAVYADPGQPSLQTVLVDVQFAAKVKALIKPYCRGDDGPELDPAPRMILAGECPPENAPEPTYGTAALPFGDFSHTRPTPPQRWEIGFGDESLGTILWQEIYVLAASRDEAMRLAVEQGYERRTVFVRETPDV